MNAATCTGVNTATYKGGNIATYTIVNIATYTRVNIATCTRMNIATCTGVNHAIHIGLNTFTLKFQNIAAKSTFTRLPSATELRPLRRKEVCFHRGGSFKEIELAA